MFNDVAPYRYLVPTIYLYVADIANPDLFACSCRSWIRLDISCFYEEQCQPFRGSACPAFSKYGVSEILQEFGWWPLSQRRKEARLILFQKISNGCLTEMPYEGALIEVCIRAQDENTIMILVMSLAEFRSKLEIN